VGEEATPTRSNCAAGSAFQNDDIDASYHHHNENDLPSSYHIRPSSSSRAGIVTPGRCSGSDSVSAWNQRQQCRIVSASKLSTDWPQQDLPPQNYEKSHPRRIRGSTTSEWKYDVAEKEQQGYYDNVYVPSTEGEEDLRGSTISLGSTSLSQASGAGDEDLSRHGSRRRGGSGEMDGLAALSVAAFLKLDDSD